MYLSPFPLPVPSVMPQRQLGQRYSDPAWSQWSQSVVCRWDTDFSSSTTSLNSPHETRDGTSNCTNSPSAPNHTCKSRMSRKSPHSRQMNPPFAPWRDHSHSPPRKRAPSSCSDWDAPCAPSYAVLLSITVIAFSYDTAESIHRGWFRCGSSAGNRSTVTTPMHFYRIQLRKNARVNHMLPQLLHIHTVEMGTKTHVVDEQHHVNGQVDVYECKSKGLHESRPLYRLGSKPNHSSTHWRYSSSESVGTTADAARMRKQTMNSVQAAIFFHRVA